MKALSLWQPWASAIALGLKRIETRSWTHSYRGTIAIHAAKRPITNEDCCYFEDEEQWEKFIALAHLMYGPAGNETLAIDLPYGKIVAIADLTLIGRVEALMRDGEVDDVEQFWGNYEPGRYGWVLANIKALDKPIPYRGAQGLFEVPDSLFYEGGWDMGDPAGSWTPEQAAWGGER